MKSLKLNEGSGSTTYLCVHWRSFPPLGAGEDPEALRAAKTITDEQYNHLLIWKRDCGLMEMDPSKCLTCPHRRQVAWKTTGPVLVDPKGQETPVVDIAAGEAASHNRHMVNIFQRPGTKGSHQTAAWVPKEKGTDEPEGNG